MRGVLRLRWWLYTLAAIPGYIAWGLLYAAIGIGLFKTGQAVTVGKTWAIVVSTVFVIMLSLFILVAPQQGRKGTRHNQGRRLSVYFLPFAAPRRAGNEVEEPIRNAPHYGLRIAGYFPATFSIAPPKRRSRPV